MAPLAFSLALPLLSRASGARAPLCTRRTTPVAVARAPAPAATAGGAGAAAGGVGVQCEHRLATGVRARTVAAVGTSATLGTASAVHDGVPFGSFCDYVLDDCGRPLLLLAAASEHTKNITAGDGRVSLYCSGRSGQAGCRVTLVGRVGRVEGEECEEAREDFVEKHSYAEEALEYPDLFGFYRMEVEGVYFVGGYGVVAEWVDLGDYKSGEADPIAKDAGNIIAEMNETRVGEMRSLCEVFLCVEDAEKVTMTGLDRLGFDLRVKDGHGKIREYRIAFREQVTNSFDCQSALVKAFQEAWEMQNGFEEDWETEEARKTVMYYALT